MLATGSHVNSGITVQQTKKPWLLFLVTSLMSVGVACILFRQPHAWPFVTIEALLLLPCALQYGSRVFAPMHAAARRERFSNLQKDWLRSLARTSFLVGVACMVIMLLGFIFDYPHALAFQMLGSTLLYIIPNSLLDLIGEGGSRLYALDDSSRPLIPDASKPLHSSHWQAL